MQLLECKMTDGALVAFQMEEIFDIIKYTVCGLVLILGISLWVHATYFREENNETR
tara:strand:- start:143 stop:310 length:168 start_codon:yes stop_codon:yes gene_type:complete